MATSTSLNYLFETLSLQSTLFLNAGDRIWLKINKSNTDSESLLFDNNNHHTHFTGWLIEEDIFNQ